MDERRQETEMVPAAEAARELETTALAVLMQIKRGRLAGIEQAGGWYVSRASLVAFRAAAAGAGPELCRSACARKAHCGSCA
jgi:hypothetical protein